jgi:NTP pyrophosphatase (non-canonical NTP hydrolase)
MDKNTSIFELKELVKDFCEKRDWEKFHDPKELAIGIATEAGELLQHFRFKYDDDFENMFSDKKKREEIEDEFSDIFYFMLRFAQMNNIDISTALKRKINKNEKKYPINKVKGLNKKYNEYN